MSKKSELVVPDKKRLSFVQTLCDLKEPYKKFGDSEELFRLAMRESIMWHQKESSFYKKFASLAHNFQKLSDIPFIPAEFFKRNEVLSVPKKSVYLHLTSSGTTGLKSQMFFDRWSIESAQRMVDRIFESNKWVSKKKCNYLLYTYQTETDSKLGTAYTDNFLCKYAPVNRVEFALKLNGNGGHDFDLFGCIKTLNEYAEAGLPVRIFGFPAFFYATLLRMNLVKLHKESLVFLGGGWKGHADKAITKEELYGLANKRLKIPDERLRDGFGSVEHCIPYVECKNHRFHVPIWSRVLIRDLRTLAPLPYGKEGFLQFLSPYITSVPAISVLMGDLARLHDHKSCNCGLHTPWFEILGRAGTSKNKSCAVAASELLRSFA